MPINAEAHAHTIGTNRNCTVEISNITSDYFLINPKVHMESGFPFSPPQPTLSTNKVEVCSFTKDDNTPSGSVGVMTYEIFKMMDKKVVGVMAVMFSVPFDYNFYKNWLGVGIFEVGRTCDKALFDFMYNEKDYTSFKRYEADGSGLTHHGDKLDVRACMNDEGQGIVKIELYDRMG